MNFSIADSDDCKQCPRVLAEIEHIDDEADGAGINFVKIDDKAMAKEFGVFALPAILFFRQNSREPVIYAGLSPIFKFLFVLLFCVKCDCFRIIHTQVICIKKIKFSIG